MNIFDINPDISKAHTLSSKFYTEERYFHESKEKIFARSWQFVGATDEINNLKPFTILEDFLDEPVLFSKDSTNNLQCLSNVCTHRGNILIENDCVKDGIRCRYHGRRFALDGTFLSMPEFENVKDFPGKKDDLTKIPFGIWQNFLFASINPSATFENFTAEMRRRIDWFDFDKLKLTSTKYYTIKAHWALYCENYLEGFHIPFVHQSLNETIDFGSYTTETFRFSSLQTAMSEPPAVAGGLSSDIFNFDGNIAAYYFFLFPNMMFNFYPWGLSVNIVKPINPEQTKISFLTFVSDETKLEKGAGADLHKVELEDEAIVENVQKGIKSKFYESGRYSPKREQGTHHFHRLIAEFMNK